jgi:hypothetical protein
MREPSGISHWPVQPSPFSPIATPNAKGDRRIGPIEWKSIGLDDLTDAIPTLPVKLGSMRLFAPLAPAAYDNTSNHVKGE